MDPEHKKILRMNRVDLARSIYAEDILEGLINRLIYTPIQMEDILSKGSKQRVVNFLLNDIETCGCKAFKAFAESLVEAGHGHLAERLIPGISRVVIMDIDQDRAMQVKQENGGIGNHPATTRPLNSNGTLKYMQGDHRAFSNQLLVSQEERHLQLGSNPDVIGTPMLCQPTSDVCYMDPEMVYKMTASPRGFAVIVNNETFRSLKRRLGTQYDVRKLEYVFKEFKFAVSKHNNLSAAAMRRMFQELSSQDHSKFDCLIVCILTHGTQGGLYGSDEGLVGIEEVTNCFYANRCPTLAGKPKLFFIQACRGESFDNRIESTDGSPVVDETNIEATGQSSHFQAPHDQFHLVDAVQDKLPVPSQSDVLLAYSTIQGFVSWRNAEQGSWFVQALCEVFLEHARKEDLLSMMTMVNQKAYAYESTKGRHKQMPVPSVTMLRKKLFFFPGS